MTQLRRALAAALVLCALGGCGQKGDLYLPTAGPAGASQAARAG